MIMQSYRRMRLSLAMGSLLLTLGGCGHQMTTVSTLKPTCDFGVEGGNPPTNLADSYVNKNKVDKVHLSLTVSGFPRSAHLTRTWTVTPGPGSVTTTPSFWGFGTSDTDFVYDVPLEAAPGSYTAIILDVVDESGNKATCETILRFADSTAQCITFSRVWPARERPRWAF
jgi:hypothetical protein